MAFVRHRRSVPRAGVEPATHGSSGHVPSEFRNRARTRARCHMVTGDSKWFNEKGRRAGFFRPSEGITAGELTVAVFTLRCSSARAAVPIGPDPVIPAATCPNQAQFMPILSEQLRSSPPQDRVDVYGRRPASRQCGEGRGCGCPRPLEIDRLSYARLGRVVRAHLRARARVTSSFPPRMTVRRRHLQPRHGPGA